MVSTARVTALFALSALAGCSINFDRFVASRPAADGGVPVDTGPVASTDTGVVPPRDMGVVPPGDTGVVPPGDTGVAPPSFCRAPYLVAVTENLDNNASRLLRWSFADNRRCADLALSLSHPRAVGVAFDSTSSMEGPQIVVVNDSAVSLIDSETGALIRDVPSEGPPRSVFDIVSNGQGTFAVAYSFTGDSPPGSVGTVRVFDHRSSLRLLQTWQRNSEFGLSVLSMSAFPGNQGQYIQLRAAESGSGLSAYVSTPSGTTGLHPRSNPPLVANRLNAQALHAYRTADRRGHYALPFSGSGTTPTVFIASAEVSSSTLRDVFIPTLRCSEPCPAITRAVAIPTTNDAAAALCELSGTSYSVVRFGGASTDCHMLDTTATPGRWRINDLALVPR